MGLEKKLTIKQKLILIARIIKAKEHVAVLFLTTPTVGDTITVGNYIATFKKIK